MNHLSPLRTTLAAAVLSLSAAAASAADYRFDGNFTFSDISGITGQTFSGTFSLDLPPSDFDGEVLLQSFSFSFGGQTYTITTTDALSAAAAYFEGGQFKSLQYESFHNGTSLYVTTGFEGPLLGSLTHIDAIGQLSSGDFQISAVPEPETYALMLGGLGLVGWMARRRKA